MNRLLWQCIVSPWRQGIYLLYFAIKPSADPYNVRFYTYCWMHDNLHWKTLAYSGWVISYPGIPAHPKKKIFSCPQTPKSRTVLQYCTTPWQTRTRPGTDESFEIRMNWTDWTRKRTAPIVTWLVVQYSFLCYNLQAECMCVSADLDLSRFWIPYDVTHCLGMRSSLKCRKVTYKMCVAHPRKWIRFLLASTVLADLDGQNLRFC